MGQQTQLVKEDLSGSTVGRYLVLRRLGTGGMGEVYLAEDTKLKRTVALKRMGARLRSDERYRHRFLKEAERASRLMHPQIAALHDILEIDGEMFLVIEYVDGKTLRKAIPDALDFELFLRVAVQCADALEAAHASGLVHRDIKPENIMMTTSGSVKILDFGLSKDLPGVISSEPAEKMATSGALSGTPAYMAPEVLLELRPDGRADIFSLGVVLYEILTGQHPFLANSFVETTDRIIRQSPPPIRDLNPQVLPEIEQVVMRMLAKKPEERYESASQLAQDLRNLQRQLQLEPSPVQAGHISGTGIVIRSPRSLWSTLPVVALLIVMALGLGALGWRLYRQSRLGAIPNKRHLAVLPFRTAGNDASSTAFSDGLTETLTVKLTHLTDKYPIEVVPMSELRYEKVSSAEQAQKTFNVNLVLEGQLQTAGKLVRINYSLVDPLSRKLLRADTITADYTDPFAVEDRVVDSVLGTLDLELRRTERESIRARGTNDPEAYDLYLRGRGYLQDYEKTENVDSAITVLTRAVERDKSFGAAYGKLGSAFLFKYRQTHDAAWIDRARQSCDRSKTLAENDVAGHVCFGTYYSYTGRYELAAEEFRRAIKLEPTEPALYLSLAGSLQQSRDFVEAEKTLVQAINLSRSDLGNYKSLANFYVSSGRFEEAAQIYRRMTELAPDNFRGYQNLGAMYIYLGRYRDALPALEKSVTIRPTAGAYSNLATAQFYLKDYGAAAEGYRQAIALDPRDNTYWRNLGDAYYWNPDTRDRASTAYIKAVELCQQGLKVNPKDVRLLRNLGMSQAMLDHRLEAVDTLQIFVELSPKDPVSLYDAALIYAHFGAKDAALLWLKKALDAGTTAAMVRDTPDLQKYLKDAKFQMLLQNR